MIIDTPERYFDGVVDLRLGDYREALADVERCDAVVVDSPYSEVTHSGHDAVANSWADGCERQTIGYGAWGVDDVRAACTAWSARCAGWMVSITDDALAPSWRLEMAASRPPEDGAHPARTGRYVFAPLPAVVWGSRVRAIGDGPSSISYWVVVARPRTREASQWGTLPGAYVGQRERQVVPGGKPLWLMRAIVRDYSRAGDLVVDPCAGGATTLIASAIEGRRAVGSELDPETFALAVARIKREAHRFTVHDGEQGPTWKPRQARLL